MPSLTRTLPPLALVLLLLSCVLCNAAGPMDQITSAAQIIMGKWAGYFENIKTAATPAVPQAAASEVPVIDISALTSSDESARLKTIKAISTACEEIGFFVITNHGVDKTVIDSTWGEVYDFFSQDDNEKLKWAGMTEEYPYGYEQGEVLSAGKSAEKGEKADVKPDIKETFTIGPSNEKAGMPARILPTSPPQFGAQVTAYYSEMEVLYGTLLSAMAVGLDLPADWFAAKTDHHISALRTLNYPNQNTKPEPGQLRAGEQADERSGERARRGASEAKRSEG